MLRKSSWLLMRSIIAVGLVLATASIYLVHKEHETLTRLLNPGSEIKTTDVYSRWLDLKNTEGPSWEAVVGWLGMLEYRLVPASPAVAGEYHAAYPTLIVFARPFSYPDKALPAQLLELHFSDHRLDHIEALSGHATLDEWRLEPARLAQWASGSKTARVQVKVSELPPYVPRAVIAIEDKRFFEHGAFDAVGIARALWVDLRHAQLRQGASTISQQLARSIFLDVHRTWRRKVLEASLALYLELRYSKPQLLEMYLNQVYWGQEGQDSLIGIESVSQSLFGKPARALTVAESAILAGMLQSPNRYSPRSTVSVSDERRKIVLNLMRDQKFITDEQYQSALTEKVRLRSTKKSSDSAYFLANLHDQLSARYSLPVLLNEGWRIFTTLDPLLEREAVAALKPPIGQAALVAIDPKSGAILSWIGGTNFQTSPFDRASDAKRQPGSAFKPFVALAALESRKATTATLLDDKPLTLRGEKGSWTPQNYDRKYRGKVSLWDSIVYSFNVPMVRLALLTGLTSILDVAQRAGIQSPLRQDLSLALGTSEVSLVELTGAYATLAGEGSESAPYSIQSILGQDDRIVESHVSVRAQAFAPEVVYLVTQMLQAVLDVGTGRAARGMGFTSVSAGKTGTSENYQDAWFIGYTPVLVAGVWVGFDKPKSLGHSAAGVALPLWTAFMKKAVLLYPSQGFKAPDNLTWKTIDTDTGYLAKSGCPHRLKEAFLPGTEPTKDCPVHAGGIVGFFKRLRVKT